jgi:hypothetical protein
MGRWLMVYHDVVVVVVDDDDESHIATVASQLVICHKA